MEILNFRTHIVPEVVYNHNTEKSTVSLKEASGCDYNGFLLTF